MLTDVSEHFDGENRGALALVYLLFSFLQIQFHYARGLSHSDELQMGLDLRHQRLDARLDA
ncbi:hypothetical protein BH24GEM3_BH24GEM3_03970 [soil metagenome]